MDFLHDFDLPLANLVEALALHFDLLAVLLEHRFDPLQLFEFVLALLELRQHSLAHSGHVIVLHLSGIHPPQGGVGRVDLGFFRLPDILQVNGRQLRVVQEVLLVLLHRVQATPVQNRPHLLHSLPTVFEPKLLLDLHLHFVGQKDHHFLVSANFPQPSDSLHQTILSQHWRKRQGCHHVGIHLHVGSSGPALVENDEGLMIWDAGALLDELPAVQVVHFPHVLVAEGNPSELVRELLVIGDPFHDFSKFLPDQQGPGIDHTAQLLVSELQGGFQEARPLGSIRFIDVDNIQSVLQEHVEHLAVCAFDAQVFIRAELDVGGEEAADVLGARESDGLLHVGEVPRGGSDGTVELDHVLGEDALHQPEGYASPVLPEDLEQVSPLAHRLDLDLLHVLHFQLRLLFWTDRVPPVFENADLSGRVHFLLQCSQHFFELSLC